MAEEYEYVESDDSDEGEITRDFDLEGADEDQYSYILKSARSVLKEKHPKHEKTAWNVSSGTVIGDILQTPPKDTWGMGVIEPECEHSDVLPTQMAEVITRTTKWVDITSLSPPDGKFETFFVDAVKTLNERALETGNTITIRMLFGNIIGMPVDCDALIDTFTKDIPEEKSNIKLWVGAWRKGFSWNHSKIIAVDGEHLLTGGHNLWDDHYLKTDPVHDISIEMRGKVAHDGHMFANKMWEFIKKTDKGLSVTKWFPDWVPLPKHRRVGVSQWPKRLSDYPPAYVPLLNPSMELPGREVPVLSMGRYGALHKVEAQANPSDSAISAMIDSAKRIIKLSLQDFGPLCLPGIPGPTSIPGGVWPKEYLKALALGIYDRDLDVEVVLSNANSVPGKLSPATANYGNGWSTIDVGCEIIRAIKEHVEDIEEDRLLEMVRKNLRITMLRTSSETAWEDGEFKGNHAKFFIIDDRAFYIGSQNLYIANLAEWGLLIDDEEETAKVLEGYWNPMWEHSYNQEEWEQSREEVLPGLNVDRNGGNEADASDEYRQLAAQALHKNMKAPGNREDAEITKWYG